MSAAHTPGPWWATENGVRDSGGYIVHTNRVQRYEGQDDRYEFEVARRESDKHLIAAAPDLLEALQAEQEWREREEAGAIDPEWDYETMVGSKRRAAIAKATGAAS